MQIDKQSDTGNTDTCVLEKAELPTTTSICIVSCDPSRAATHIAVDAFIALGGNADKTGQISTERLRSIVKDFGLTIDIAKLIQEYDTDRSGFVDYQEFAEMMK